MKRILTAAALTAVALGAVACAPAYDPMSSGGDGSTTYYRHYDSRGYGTGWQSSGGPSPNWRYGSAYNPGGATMGIGNSVGPGGAGRAVGNDGGSN